MAALRLASRGLGQCWPNPAVGALLLDQAGHVVGTGTTAKGGRPHAETIAISEAGASAKGGILYVSLEPCAHQGQTPPCTDAIIAAGIQRVVCPISDPDTRVAGNGFQKLQDAGIEVTRGILVNEANRIAIGHISRVTRGRPHLQLKLAISADGFIGRAGDGQVAITGDVSRNYVHRMRAMSDAILVGRGTVEVDNPDLRCRLLGCGDLSPVRVILDSGLKLSLESKLVKTAKDVPVWVFSGPNIDKNRHETMSSLGVKIEPIEQINGGKLDLNKVLVSLGQNGITRLMVEGGSILSGALLDGDFIDELVVFESRLEIGKNGILPFDDRKIDVITGSPLYYLAETRDVGDDKMHIFRKRRL